MSFNNFNEPGPVEVDLLWAFGDDEEERELVVEASYRPGRAAPSCANQNAAEFSDPGDPAEWTVRLVREKKTGAVLNAAVWKEDSAFDEAVGEALLEDLNQHRGERAYARVGYP